MEWSTDPKMLEGRAFYKLGETVHDHHKKILIIGIFSCLLLGSLISMGPNWADTIDRKEFLFERVWSRGR